MNQTQPTLTTKDKARLTTQAQRVFTLMKEHPGWWTLKSLALQTHTSEAGASARLRDFRKPEWGSHQVDRRRIDNVYWYRLIANGPLLDGKRNAPTAKMEAREFLQAWLDKTSELDYQRTSWEQTFETSLRELLK